MEEIPNKKLSAGGLRRVTEQDRTKDKPGRWSRRYDGTGLATPANFCLFFPGKKKINFPYTEWHLAGPKETRSVFLKRNEKIIVITITAALIQIRAGVALKNTKKVSQKKEMFFESDRLHGGGTEQGAPRNEKCGMSVLH